MTTIVERYPQSPYGYYTEKSIKELQRNATASSWKLEPEHKEQWLKALRSGEYEQGQGQLVSFLPSGTHYCCLGVLATVVPAFKPDDLTRIYIRDTKAAIPMEIQGLLASFNDFECWNFDQIANWIEDNL